MGIPTPPFIELGTIGFDDSIILMLLALVVFGPRRLPQIGKQIGKLMYEFRKASNDFKLQMEEELRAAEDAERQKREEERQRQLDQQTEEQLAEAEAEAAGQAQKALPSGSETVGDENSSHDSYEGGYAGSEEQATWNEEPELRVQPPATGEPVAAERPGSVHREAGRAQDTASANGEAMELATRENSGLATIETAAAKPEEFSVEKEITAAEAGAVTEPAGHLG